MNANRLISIKEPILEALSDMGIDHGKNIPDLTRWAVRAESIIGSYYSYRKRIGVISVDKFRAELPCDAVFVQRVLLGEYDCDLVDLFSFTCAQAMSMNITADDTFLVIDNPEGNTAVQIGGLKWEVQNGHVILNHDYDGQKLTIQYLGLETDEGEFPLVCENHMEAIIHYIMYRYAQRSRFSQNKMDLSEVNMLRQEFNNLAADARAEDSRLSESQRAAIVAMIHDPLVGYGLELGMNNRYD